MIERRTVKNKKTRYTKVQTITLKATKKRTLSGKHKTLKAGHYRVVITTTDLAEEQAGADAVVDREVAVRSGRALLLGVVVLSVLAPVASAADDVVLMLNGTDRIRVDGAAIDRRLRFLVDI